MIQNPSLDDTSEIALPPGSFAYHQDTAKGFVRTSTGSSLIQASGQKTPVQYDHRDRRFQECSLSSSVRSMPLAEEGDYLVLENPAEDEGHPKRDSGDQDCPNLAMGSKVNLSGPCQFALWPGQHATLVPGHNLRSNQYLECRVYNERAATENWKAATIRRTEAAGEEESPAVVEEGRTFIAGQRLIIRGDEVSFFIPPTGIEVLTDGDDYVREAITLERLEYCILIDEDGNKRYERGPQVVFPQPTEVFHTDNGRRKFRAFELNPIQGLHIKVIADYNDDGTSVKEDKEPDHSEGDELFITGEDHPIYFPRPEHSIIRYGDRNKQFATEIPPGEGRYVLNRLTGEITTRRGFDMLLPDPRTEVIVKRILTERQSQLWYPDNDQALAYNRDLAQVAGGTDTQSRYIQRKARDDDFTETFGGARSLYERESVGDAAVADEFSRGTKHTPPRTLTLDTKFEGVPQICPWTGYAVMVVDKSGKRRVEVGPTTVLLNFDEALEILTLSTGKPKNTDDLISTVYLRVMNNKISDIVQNVFTADHVPIDLKLSFTVDFEGEPENWFNIENYVKFLCDHVRSVLKGRIRKVGIKEFWASGADFIRDFVLGEAVEGVGRPGMAFKQNGMRITDVEILEITIKNDGIARMLQAAEEQVVSNHIKLEQSERELETLTREEAITRDSLKARHETTELKAKLDQKRIKAELDTTLAQETANQESSKAQQASTTEREQISAIETEAELARDKSQAEQEHAVAEAKAALEQRLIIANTEALEKRFGAMQDGFTEAMLALSSQEALAKLAEAGSVQKMLGGGNLVEIVNAVVGDSQLTDKIKQIADRAGLVGSSVLDE